MADAFKKVQVNKDQDEIRGDKQINLNSTSSAERD